MMTNAPTCLRNIRDVIQRHTGLTANDLGIVPDELHRRTGGYHCGKDDLLAAFPDLRKSNGLYEYSVREPRDLAGLTNSASALDIGMFPSHWAFIGRLVEACQVHATGTSCIREIIYSTDGQSVKHYDAINQQTGGDSSHLWHSHISFWRDTEGRPERAALAGLISNLLASVTPGRPAPSWPGIYLKYTPAQHLVWNTHVRMWQQKMRDRGWSISADGLYGPKSRNVCIAFQREKHLEVDGIVGPVTWSATFTLPVT